MFSYKSRYCVAAAMVAMAALTGHVEARDIDLQSIDIFSFLRYHHRWCLKRIHCSYRIVLNM